MGNPPTLKAPGSIGPILKARRFREAPSEAGEFEGTVKVEFLEVKKCMKIMAVFRSMMISV